MREKVWYFDLLRVVAAVAVVVIHVLGPYREQLGQIPDWEWITAITFNSFSRWAVPVFIMITGALMLSDERPFEGRYYLKRRVGKVLIPFVVWSVFYAFFSAFSASGTNFATSWKLLTDMPFHETYYHLGFFYYFIPLYLIVPFYQWAIQRMEPGQVKGVVMVWLVITASYLFHIDGLWSETYLLYSGYLILGYCLYKYHWPPMVLLIPLAIVALLITDYMVVSHSLTAGEYKIGRWLSYKTINTAIAAAGVFVLCRYISDKLGDTSREKLSVISRHSLGIYLLHPIFLWPVRNYDWYFANPLIAIPFWTLVAGGLAFATSWLLSRSTKTAWLVP
ncbi:acyltransferase [Photobacterium leiognathi]|uniref:acyltransferase n=1 Tax=Photobacterium leiognathi TaxID=553611 RepID=UPI002981B426|nr:acyltransferase family protein [Photobacterium leiognathi]